MILPSLSNNVGRTLLTMFMMSVLPLPPFAKYENFDSLIIGHLIEIFYKES